MEQEQKDKEQLSGCRNMQTVLHFAAAMVFCGRFYMDSRRRMFIKTLLAGSGGVLYIQQLLFTSAPAPARRRLISLERTAAVYSCPGCLPWAQVPFRPAIRTLPKVFEQQQNTRGRYLYLFRY